MVPGVCMRELHTEGVRSIVLTSGTLSPMESFAHELVRLLYAAVCARPLLRYRRLAARVAANRVPDSPGEFARHCAVTGERCRSRLGALGR